MSRSQTSLTGSAVALGALLAHAAPLAAQTALRYQFRAGDAVNCVITTKSHTTVPDGAKTSQWGCALTLEAAQRTRSVDRDGNGQLALRVHRVRAAVVGPFDPIEMDTQRKGPGGMLEEGFAALKALTEHDVTWTQDAQGKVSGLTIPEPLRKAMKQAEDNGVQIITEPYLRALIDRTVIELPEARVTPGDKWQRRTTERGAMATLELDSVFTHDGQVRQDGRRLERIGHQPKVTYRVSPEAAVDKVHGASGRGTLLFDNAAGRLAEADLTVEVVTEYEGVVSRSVQSLTYRLKR